MATYPSWIPVIGIGREQTWGDVTGLNTGNKIPSGGPVGIAVTEMPDFQQGVSTIESEKYHGYSFLRSDVSERARGIKLPATTLNFDLSSDVIVPFLITLFQRDGSNALQGSGSLYTKTFRAYTSDPDLASKSSYADLSSASSIVPMSLFLVKKTGASNEGHILKGAVAKTITISGSVDEPVKVTAEIIAKTMGTDRDYSSDDFTFNTDPTILFQDMIFELGGTETVISSFSITITNNAVQKTYDNQTVQKIVYGKMSVTGSITTPWDGSNTILDAFGGAVSSNIQRLEWGNSSTAITGAVSSDRDLYIKCAAVLTGYRETEEDGERMMEFDFEGVYDNSIMTSDQGSIEIKISDSLEYTT